MGIIKDCSDENIQRNGIRRRSFLGGVTAAIAGMTLLPIQASCQKSKSVAAINDSATAKEIDAFIKKLTDEDKFSGAVLMAKDDKPIFQKAYGLTNKDLNVANQLNTKFNVASMGKMFTTFLTVVPPENYLSLFYVKAFRALTGFCLTCVLRQIYLRFAANFLIQSIVLLVLGCAVVFGCVWAGIEVGYYLLTSPNFNFVANAVRLPSYALDYAMTLTGWSALYFGIKHWRAWQAERDTALEAVALANRKTNC